MTSHDVVACLRKLTGVKHMGHAGTLDRMATGVLPIALGSACRLLRFLSKDKIYLAQFLIGTRTDTDDIEGKVLTQVDAVNCTRELIKDLLAGFVGEQMQSPPVYSAVHHAGKRLYKLAKAGNVPHEVSPRKVVIYDLQILSIDLPSVTLRIHCSGGTYIRAIARDLGEKLGVGACLKSLVREKSGPFLLDGAISLERIIELGKSGKLRERCTDPREVLDFSVVSLDQENAHRLTMGQYIGLEQLGQSNDNLIDQKHCLVTLENCVVALCAITSDNKLRPEVVVGHAKSID
jgi:tRNA pseudouridine55 synthase